MAQLKIIAGKQVNGDTAQPHVLLVVDQFPRSLGGGERVLLRLASLLPIYGFRVSILTFHIAEGGPISDETAPCPVYLLPLDSTYNLEAWRSAWLLRRVLREQNVAIVQTFFESSDLWAGGITRLLSSAKLIWSRRDMGILRSAKHRIAYRLLKRIPHLVFAVSEQVRQHCISVDHVAAGRTMTIYNGIDVEDAASPSPVMDRLEPHIVTIGNVRRVKGHDVLIRAASEVIKTFPNARVTIGGAVLEQEYFDELTALVKELGLEESVDFLGDVPNSHTVLAGADLFVLPSRSEGFSNSIIEAMANGLPVVATDVGGNAEAVVDGETGIIVAADNDAELAKALLTLCQDPLRAKLMGERGRLRARELFSTQAMMQKTVGAYHQLLAEKHPG